MKKTFKSAITLLTASMLVFSCNQQQNNPTAEPEEEQQETPREITYTTYSAGDSNDAYVIKMEVMLPERENDQAVEIIRKTLMGFFDAPNANDPQTALNREVQKLKIHYTENHNQMVEDGFWDENPPQLENHTSITHLSTYKDIMTFVVSNSVYEGGAHGGFNKAYMLFDLNTGDLISEKDFITNKSAVSNLLRTKALKEYTRENPEFDVFDKDNITANGNFFITPDSIVYQYSEYEIAAYCFGRPMFRLHKNEMKPYIKTDSPIYKYWFGE